MTTNKIYFASDFHFGIPDHDTSLVREKRFIDWLETVSADASAIFIMGDIFDFWFEYKTVVPKGYVRLLGTLAKITDSGIPVHVFKGNHDIWAFDYLKKEIGIHLHRKAEIFEFDGKKFYLAHGDGLGPGDKGYKFLKYVFEAKINQFLFRWLHPDIGIHMGLFFSKRSRMANDLKNKGTTDKHDVNGEMLYQYAMKKAKDFPNVDFFIFGHRHIVLHEKITGKAQLIILGDWISIFSYAIFENGQMKTKYWK